jgi:hypothetical protein
LTHKEEAKEEEEAMKEGGGRGHEGRRKSRRSLAIGAHKEDPPFPEEVARLFNRSGVTSGKPKREKLSKAGMAEMPDCFG